MIKTTITLHGSSLDKDGYVSITRPGSIEVRSDGITIEYNVVHAELRKLITRHTIDRIDIQYDLYEFTPEMYINFDKHICHIETISIYNCTSRSINFIANNLYNGSHLSNISNTIKLKVEYEFKKLG